MIPKVTGLVQNKSQNNSQALSFGLTMHINQNAFYMNSPDFKRVLGSKILRDETKKLPHYVEKNVLDAISMLTPEFKVRKLKTKDGKSKVILMHRNGDTLSRSAGGGGIPDTLEYHCRKMNQSLIIQKDSDMPIDNINKYDEIVKEIDTLKYEKQLMLMKRISAKIQNNEFSFTKVKGTRIIFSSSDEHKLVIDYMPKSVLNNDATVIIYKNGKKRIITDGVDLNPLIKEAADSIRKALEMCLPDSAAKKLASNIRQINQQ